MLAHSTYHIPTVPSFKTKTGGAVRSTIEDGGYVQSTEAKAINLNLRGDVAP